MKLATKSVAWLLPFLLTACIHIPRPFHKGKQTAQPVAPAIEMAKPPAPSQTVLDLPAIASVPLIRPPEPAAIPQAQPLKPRGKRKKPAGTAVPEQESLTQEGQAAPESPGVSAIGQLSTGEPTNINRQTVDLIYAIERGLNGLGRSLNDQEQKTAAQIREFLKQARTALTSGDMDGAHTLAAKANVLLSELRH
jgi:hypothetical protein